MKTVTLDVRSPEQAAQDFVNAWKSGKAQKSARISFATPELLWKVLTAKRWGFSRPCVALVLSPYEKLRAELVETSSPCTRTSRHF